MWVSAYIWYLATWLDENTKAVGIQRQRKGQGLGLRALQHWEVKKMRKLTKETEKQQPVKQEEDQFEFDQK